jgi:hypothetical protein
MKLAAKVTGTITTPTSSENATSRPAINCGGITDVIPEPARQFLTHPQSIVYSNFIVSTMIWTLDTEHREQ